MARPSATTLGRLGLPVVALRVRRGLAAARRGAGARARADAGRRALGDRERVGRLRGRDDREACAGAGRGDGHLACAGADVEAGVAELRSRRAVRVAAGRVRGARLDLRDGVTGVRLGLCVLALLLLTEEGRQGNRGENADDQDHDEELDERKALLLAVDPLGKLPQHGYSSLGACGLASHLGSQPLGGSTANSSGVSLPGGAPELCVPISRRVCLCPAALTLYWGSYRPTHMPT